MTKFKIIIVNDVTKEDEYFYFNFYDDDEYLDMNTYSLGDMCITKMFNIL